MSRVPASRNRLLPLPGLLNAVLARVFVLDLNLQVICASLDEVNKSGHPVPATLDELLDSGLLSPLSDLDRARCVETVRQIVGGESPEPAELSWTHRTDFSSGDNNVVRVSVRPAYDARGCVCGVLLKRQEISESLLRKAQIAVMDDEGERDQDRLELARQFAVTLNHEINNPLFVVSATLEDVLSEPLEDSVRAPLETALESVWRVAEAVKRLQEMRQVVSKAYIPGYSMIDLEASSHRPGRQTKPPE